MHPCATANSDSSRRYPEAISNESGFQEDRERIIRCSAFRRLDYKTQVFVPHEHDMYRTRMTHTLEVAQVARKIARLLSVNEDLSESVALAHDLGHPPFGHAGEKVLDGLMEEHGHFEHNRQSLRIVDYLEHPFPDFRGLNLTNATRECMAKHETAYDTPSGHEFDANLRPPLEGQVCDIADEIAYTSADIEDGLASGWLTVEQISNLSLWQEAFELAESEYPDARDIHKRIAATRNLARILIEDLVANTLNRISTLGLSAPEGVRSAEKCVILSPPMTNKFMETKAFLLDNLYLHQDNVSADEESETILVSLFNAFVDSPSRLPDRYERRIDQPGHNGQVESIHRIVCDYIAGMTDRYARLEYEKIN